METRTDYGYPQYVADCTAWLAAVVPGRKVDWLGTSMGGLIGFMASTVQP